MKEFILNILGSSFVQAVLIAIVTIFIGRLFAEKGRLHWTVLHQHCFAMPRFDGSGTFPVITQQVWFQNNGRAPIEEIELVFNWRPQHFEIWDPRQYSQTTLPDDRFAITMPNLSGYEAFYITMIESVREDLPNIVNVRWKGGVGKKIKMRPQRIFPSYVYYLSLIFFFIGVASTAYAILRFALHLST